MPYTGSIEQGGEGMNAAVRRIITEQKGKILIMVLVLLLIGGLILAPLLGLMSTGLTAGQVYEKKAAELYAADAGVEQAIWHLQQGGDPDDVLTLTVNGKDVTVTMTHLNPTQCHEPALYEITSEAIGEDGSGTTVMAHVTNITVYLEPGEDVKGYLGANVYSSSDLFVHNDSQIQGNVIVAGDLILNACSVVGGIVCVGGDLTLNEGAQIQSDIYVVGSLDMQGGSGSWVDGDVHIGGTVNMEGKAEIRQDLWAGGNSVKVDKNAKILGDVHVTALNVVSASGTIGGQIYEDYYDHNCPLGFAPPEIVLWLII
jgi:carbonic anhydrase/acetyltransferase-like protein (isoleucine patch superfamily)